MIRKTNWTIFFTLLAAALLTALAGAAEDAPPELPLRAVVLYEESASPEQMEALLAGTDGVTLLCRYETFFTGAAVEADAKTLASLARLDGVSGVGLAEYYDYASSSTGRDAFTSEECLALMNADKFYARGYTGDGTVIAVLDSGCNVSHEVFADASLMKSPALSKADIEAFSAKGGTKGAYVSTRIPFAYDYYSRDADVSTTIDHGTHVTALAAGYARDRSGGTTFRGAAPGAQILAMKIFPDGSSGGTDDTLILRALEDAWNLGADIVNLSVGTGAGFSGSDTMNGLYCRAYTQMAESGVIVCCAAGNSGANVCAKTWGRPLPTGSYTDYGSVCSPGSLYGVLGIAAASRNSSGGLTAADYSSWGPASGLHLDPALTAFGGPVTAAASGKNNQYLGDAGTSMASPYAAGSMAVLLQSIRERGVTDRRQASALVQQMMESHTQLLTDSASGLPVSPRRQGAGLIDLDAAFFSSLVMTTPLIELGSSEAGQFTMPVTLRNLSKQPMQVTLGIQVLTDDYGVQNGVSYSRMTPRNITSGVTATVSGSRTVTVPAQRTATVVVNLSVTSKLKEELARVYPNGFYVEGYITAASAGGETAHGAFLGYCGDWNAAPVLEPTDFRDIQNAAYRLEGGTAVSAVRKALPDNWDRYLSAVNANVGANTPFLAADRSARSEDGAVLGFNGHANVPPSDARNAIPSRDTTAMTTAGGVLCLDVYTQRNAAGAVMLVSDQKTGEVYYAEKALLLKKSTENSSGDAVSKACTFAWDGADANGTPLPAGTKVRVDVCAWLDTDKAMQAAYSSNMRGTAPASYAWMLKPEYEKYRELSFPVTLDGAPPTAEASLEGTTLKLTIRDDQYTAYAAIQSTDGRTLAGKAYALEEPGQTCTLSTDFSGGTLPKKVYIQLEDYATNTVCYELDLQALSKGGAAPLAPCAAAALTDVPPASWYHEAVDYILERGVMGTDGGAFYPDKGATRWEIVSALYHANGRPETSLALEDLPFHDVPGYSRHITELCWAYEQGVVLGRIESAFFGTASVPRQELALMLYRCAKLNGKDSASGSLASFSDAGSVAEWAKEAMRWAVGADLIRGNESGNLVPEAGVSRAETAQILMRFMEMA